VAEAQRRAKKRLPRSVYLALVAGSEQGITLDDNVKAFSEIGYNGWVTCELSGGDAEYLKDVSRRVDLILAGK